MKWAEGRIRDLETGMGRKCCVSRRILIEQ